MFDRTNYDMVPSHTLDGIDNYVKHGVPTGGFLHAVLTNDLFGALGRADLNNRIAIWDICRYIHNEIPAGLSGSEEKVKAHYERKRKEKENEND